MIVQVFRGIVKSQILEVSMINFSRIFEVLEGLSIVLGVFAAFQTSQQNYRDLSWITAIVAGFSWVLEFLVVS